MVISKEWEAGLGLKGTWLLRKTKKKKKISCERAGLLFSASLLSAQTGGIPLCYLSYQNIQVAVDKWKNETAKPATCANRFQADTSLRLTLWILSRAAQGGRRVCAEQEFWKLRRAAASQIFKYSLQKSSVGSSPYAKAEPVSPLLCSFPLHPCGCCGCQGFDVQIQ